MYPVPANRFQETVSESKHPERAPLRRTTAFGRFRRMRTLAIALVSICAGLLGSGSAAFARPSGVEREATPAAQANSARAVPGIGAARGGQAATRDSGEHSQCRPRDCREDGWPLVLADLLGCVDCRLGVGAWRCSVGHAVGFCVSSGRPGRAFRSFISVSRGTPTACRSRSTPSLSKPCVSTVRFRSSIGAPGTITVRSFNRHSRCGASSTVRSIGISGAGQRARATGVTRSSCGSITR